MHVWDVTMKHIFWYAKLYSLMLTTKQKVKKIIFFAAGGGGQTNWSLLQRITNLVRFTDKPAMTNNYHSLCTFTPKAEANEPIIRKDRVWMDSFFENNSHGRLRSSILPEYSSGSLLASDDVGRPRWLDMSLRVYYLVLFKVLYIHIYPTMYWYTQACKQINKQIHIHTHLMKQSNK